MRLWNGIAGLILVAGLAGGAIAGAQQQPLSVRAANVALSCWDNGRFAPAGGLMSWTHDEFTLLDGMGAVWRNAADPRYFDYIKRSVDPLLFNGDPFFSMPDGMNPLVDIELGHQLMLLYGATTNRKYFNGATFLYHQGYRPDFVYHYATPSLAGPSEAHPMTLHEAYEALPFFADYAFTFHHPEALAAISKEFVKIQDHTRDPKTGLLRDLQEGSKHAEQSTKLSGNSARELARSMGWYMAALVDTIRYYAADDPERKQLIAILNEDAAAVARLQDAKTGLWQGVVDEAEAKGNSPDADATASCLLIYALAKGVRRGYLPERYDAIAERAYEGVLSRFVSGGTSGDFSFRATGEAANSSGASDGGRYACGARQTMTNSPMGVGAFILASTEIESVKIAKIGRGDNVMVDAWFNSQKRMDPTGHEIYFHYKWDEVSNPGYSLWGHAFRNFGARTTALYAEPTFENLRPAQVYIIASPDNLDKNPQAHFANETDAKEIAKWVKSGGVLAIMENDTSFADLDHFNVVAAKFGIHFNSTLRMHVVGTNWAMGRFYLDGDGPIFHHPHTAYVKDVCTISVKAPAVPVYTHDKDIFMAVAKYGKGTVYAMVDPWFYNEYTNGLKLPAEYDNYAAGVELAKWLLEQVPKGEGSGGSGQGTGGAAARP